MYYRLTYISSADKEKRGDYILNGDRPLKIGQSVSCDVRLPEPDEYEPQIFAVILSSGKGKGWYVVRRTDCYDIQVNGSPVSVARILKDGDELAFGDGKHETVLKFKVLNDGEYDATSGFIYKKHTNVRLYFVLLAFLSIAAISVVSFLLFTGYRADLRHADLRVYGESVYHIQTDSIYLLCDTVINGEKRQVVVEAVELSSSFSGTCFLTEDCLLVTARHCVEPWINDEEWDGSNLLDMSPEVRLAVMAETGNRLSGRQKYRLRSHCVVSRGLERYDFYSTDFYMNKSRDKVIRLGMEKEVFYWRTIFPIANRRDMELGDFAYLDVSGIMEKGNMVMASQEEMFEQAYSQTSHDIVVIGYPLNDNGTSDMVVTVYGNSQPFEFDEEKKEFKGCIQMSAPINRGNSGGPVLARIDGRIKVIGIVSKADGRASQGMFWAVPITEVAIMHEQGNVIQEDSLIFRR